MQQKRLFSVLLCCCFVSNANGFTFGSAGHGIKPHIWSLPAKSNHAGGDSKDDDSNSQGDEKSEHLQQDIAKRFSLPRDKAISALSQPTSSSEKDSKNLDPRKMRSRNRRLSRETLLPRGAVGVQDQRQRGRYQSTGSQDDYSFLSLLPPPIKESNVGASSKGEKSNDDGLSSWEDFLASGTNSKGSSPITQPDLSATPEKKSSPKQEGKKETKMGKAADQTLEDNRLPSIADLFPPDNSLRLPRDDIKSSSYKHSGNKKKNDSSDSSRTRTLDGVLPVSDLFYRSSQAMNEDESDEATPDDEELPFSAEQSDKLSTGNRIRVRRNQARVTSSRSNRTNDTRPPRSSAARRMVRRGMEMLVGGIPINADPPQRYVDLMYAHMEAEKSNWYEAVTMNTRDFGPLLHAPSVGLVSEFEQGLFCEHFVHYTTKWGVCPPDLRAIVKFSSSQTNAEELDAPVPELDFHVADEEPARTEPLGANRSLENSAQGFGTLKTTIPIDPDDEESELRTKLGGELHFSIGVTREDLESADSLSETPVLERVLARGIAASTDCTGFNVVFTKLVLTDMEDGSTQVTGEFRLEIKDRSLSFGELRGKARRINSSLAQAMDEGDMQLAMAAAAREETAWTEDVRSRVVEEFLFEDDEGDFPWEESEANGSSQSIEEDQDFSYDQENQDLSYLSNKSSQEEDGYDGPFGEPGSVEYHSDDIFMGGGNDGVFWDYSASNVKNSPYAGALGLRLVEAVALKAKERHPRVIAIGDVHGCIDELQELLRQCDYRPGDLVVFLGDLVSKGPDSVSVIQLAREIGSIGVRGNHDFEVIRWHQAIKSGVDPPVVGSEHFHIASCLSKADMKWLYSLPWYISSRELSALFVHAGFVSGIRLSKQNPRLMMNMRSILPDGTVTSKFFNNWPWARLWDGPQTVLFGHDADRGLQQYEHAIGLDTGCVYGGRLTACILPEKRLVSVSARREYFKYRRKHYD